MTRSRKFPTAPTADAAEPQAPAAGPLMTIDVDLDFPILVHGEECNALTMHRLQARDMVKLDGLGEMAQACKMVELSARIPAGSVASMDLVDLMKCAKAAERFFARGPATGKKR